MMIKQQYLDINKEREDAKVWLVP